MKNALLCLMLASCTLEVFAEGRTLEEMRSIAVEKLLQVHAVKGVAGMQINNSNDVSLIADAAGYCIFAPAEGSGFVIVAKEASMKPVIGYSHDSYQDSDLPDGLQWYLEAMSQKSQMPTVSVTRSSTGIFEPVENFMTTQWSQEHPFNLLTPNKYPAGCVATALAQCMNYCQWPASAEFEAEYAIETIKGKTTTTEWKNASVSSTYTWPYQDTYKTIGSTKDNIGELLRDCGYATFMRYGQHGSASIMCYAGEALVSRFRYPEECIKYMDYEYTSSQEEWVQTIYDELMHKCPVLFGASDANFGGHAFVLSGIDDDGLVYVNWGWRGKCDGYYDLMDLTPVMNSKEIHFQENMQIVYGIRPVANHTDHIESRIFGIIGSPYTFRFSLEKDNLGVARQTLYAELPYGFINYNATEFHGVFGLFAKDLTDGTDWVIAPELQDRDTIPSLAGYYGTNDNYKDFAYYYYIDGEQGLKPGHTYRMSFGVRDDREDVWRSILCHGGGVAYDITYTGDSTTSTIANDIVEVPIVTGIHQVEAPATDDALTRVYDLQGRLRHTAPAVQFNLRDVPFSGIVLIKSGHKVQKVVR